VNRTKPYGVLLVTGLRTHQENYAPLFASDPRCRLIAVTDEPDVPAHRAEWNRRFASEIGLPYIPDIDEALTNVDVDIVSVCAEHERRGRVAVKCAQAGKHLYLDKPMTCSIPDADAVVNAVKLSGVKSQMFSFIHTAWAQKAKKDVESGVIGEIVALHCDVMFAKGNPGTAPLGKPRKQEPYPKRFTFVESKRELRATGVYAVSLIRWITGRKFRKVFCVTANYFFAEHVKNDTEDFGLLSLTLDDGITATVACGRIGYMSHPASGPTRLVIIGTKGSLTLDMNKPHVEVYADEPPWLPPPFDPSDPMSFWSSTQKAVETRPKNTWVNLQQKSPKSINDVTGFIDCIESDKESEMSAKESAEVVEVLMSGYISAWKGEAIQLHVLRL
jgi:predicted dehydrogenase